MKRETRPHLSSTFSSLYLEWAVANGGLYYVDAGGEEEAMDVANFCLLYLYISYEQPLIG